jgi:hypothetical protein
MAIILPTKKLQSLLKEGSESFLVLTHNKSGAIRIIGMTEFLKRERNERKTDKMMV